MISKNSLIRFGLGVLTMVLSISYAQGQEGLPVYQDYLMDNLYLLHPSMAGATNCAQVRATARQQWFDQEDAPNLQTISFNTALGEYRNSGIGAIVFNDKNGYHSQTGAYLSYAHHILLGDGYGDLNRLSFGISAGLVQSRLDETNFDPAVFDPVITGVLLSDSYFNIDIGASYLMKDFFIHATVKNPIFQNRGLYSEEFESSNQMRYIVNAGYLFDPAGSDWEFEPSVLYQRTDRTKEQFVDLNAKAFYDLKENTTLYMGLSYRQSFEGAEFDEGTVIQQQNLSLLSPFIGAKFNNFTLGYTFSKQFGDVQFAGGGFHQITLGFDFLCAKERWNCNCPAVNL